MKSVAGFSCSPSKFIKWEASRERFYGRPFKREHFVPMPLNAEANRYDCPLTRDELKLSYKFNFVIKLRIQICVATVVQVFKSLM